MVNSMRILKIFIVDTLFYINKWRNKIELHFKIIYYFITYAAVCATQVVLSGRIPTQTEPGSMMFTVWSAASLVWVWTILNKLRLSDLDWLPYGPLTSAHRKKVNLSTLKTLYLRLWLSSRHQTLHSVWPTTLQQFHWVSFIGYGAGKLEYIILKPLCINLVLIKIY